MAASSAIPVDAYGFAATFKLRDLAAVLGALGGETRIKERVVVILEAGRRYALGFDFGAVVFVGVDGADQKRIVAEIVAKLAANEPYPPITEAFAFEPGATITDVRFDRVLVPELTLDIVDIVALNLAQSVAMDYYARDVEEIETQTDRIAEALRVRGRVPGGVRRLVKFIGLCIATRNDVISTLALFDKPDVTWEQEALDKLWNELHRMLEIDDRYRALEAKLRMFQDNLLVLVDLTRQRHTLQLEIAVVVLILFEVAITIVQLARGH